MIIVFVAFQKVTTNSEKLGNNVNFSICRDVHFKLRLYQLPTGQEDKLKSSTSSKLCHFQTGSSLLI